MVEDEYEIAVRRGRNRFRIVVAVVLFCIVGALFAPWVFVRVGALTSDTAEAFTVVTGVVMVAGWQALLMNVRHPSDGLPPAGAPRWRQLGVTVAIGAAILATVMFLGVLSFGLGLVGRQGLIMTFLFSFMLGYQLMKASIGRLARASMHE